MANPEQSAEDIFATALDLPDGERTAYLAQVFRDAPELRDTVVRLFSDYHRMGDFLDAPALPAPQQDLLAAGTLIAHYRIVGMIGSGGMGTVYEAEDTKLRRRVALKFLPGEFAQDPQWMQRFRVEARAASALNHPNICTIYEINEFDGREFIAMELLEGQTLYGMIEGHPLPPETVLALGVQIAAALEAARAKGIVHRDIKPANIFVTTHRQIKILDFGIAKLTGIHRHLDQTGTVTNINTQTGMIIGTIGYMSPEQVRGAAVDHRSDIFAVGCVLYEMLTAKRAFERSNMIDTSMAILNEQPPAIPEISPGVPAGLVRVVSRCLEKDPALRFQSAADLAFALQSPPAPIHMVRVVKISRRGKPAILASAAALLVVAAAYYFYYFHRSAKLTDTDTIVLADFTNSTGDPVFDGTLRQGMTVQLEQSPFLSLISEERIQKTLALMSQSPDARLTPELGREICLRTGSAAVLDGSIASLGTQYVLGLRVADCATGKLLDAEQVQAARKEDVLDALSKMASRFRTRIGESLATVERHDTPLAEATTPSLEALKAYSTGWKVSTTVGDAASVPFFQRAIQIDSQFAMGHAMLGRMYGDLGESGLAAVSIRKAYELRDRASDRERFYIETNYDLVVTGNLEQARQTCEAWGRTYPRDMNAAFLLAGWIYPYLGQYEESVASARRAIEIDPGAAPPYNALVLSLEPMGRLDEAERTLDLAAERKLTRPNFLIDRYDIAFLKGDSTAMERAAALATKASGAQDAMAADVASGLAYSGHLEQARTNSDHAVQIALQSGRPARAARFQAGAAVREGLFGNQAAAKSGGAATLKLARVRDTDYGAALASALAGDDSAAATLADDLEKRFPNDTEVRTNYVPSIRARLALNRRDPARSLDLLSANVPYELGLSGSSYLGLFDALYPIYLRGEAYLLQHRGSDAAAEFQKILNHLDTVITDPIGALAHLQLGRAYAMAGDHARAKAAYSDFLNLWKDADPDIPVLRQARKEFAALP